MNDLPCTRARELLSARRDRELPELQPELQDMPGLEGVDGPGPLLDRHLARCPGCRAFADDIERLERAVRVRPAEPVPDLTAPIAAAFARIHTRRRAAGGRWETQVALGLIAVVQLLLAAPALLLGADGGLPVHAARELDSFHVAVAVGFLVAAARPARAAGLLPVVGALTVCLAVTAGADVVTGRVPVLLETHHLVQVVGLGLVWWLARGARHAAAVAHG